MPSSNIYGLQPVNGNFLGLVCPLVDRVATMEILMYLA